MDRILLMTHHLPLFTDLNEAANAQNFFVNNTVQPSDAIKTLDEQAISAIVWDLSTVKLDANYTTLETVRKRLRGPIIILAEFMEPTVRDHLFSLHIDDIFIAPFDFHKIVQLIEQRIWVYNQITGEQPIENQQVETQTIAPENKPDTSHLQNFKNLVIDNHHYRVTRDGVDLDLTPKEFKLFKYLVDHKNQVLSRDQLLQGVWGYDIYGTSRMVDIHISHLRDKIEPDPQNPKWIKTARGFGYVLSIE